MAAAAATRKAEATVKVFILNNCSWKGAVVVAMLFCSTGQLM